jgi:pimeloyl-ACP methyl ester carboxylesterase
LFPLFVHPKRLEDAELRQRVSRMAEDVGADAFVRQQRALMARPDARSRLAAIRCPTLVLVGDADELTPPALAEEIAASTAGARLVVVTNCGHLSTMEQPAAVNAALAEWLAR